VKSFKALLSEEEGSSQCDTATKKDKIGCF